MTPVESITLYNYRRLRQLSLRGLGCPIIALFGPNGVGKTTILEAFSIAVGGTPWPRPANSTISEPPGGGGWPRIDSEAERYELSADGAFFSRQPRARGFSIESSGTQVPIFSARWVRRMVEDDAANRRERQTDYTSAGDELAASMADVKSGESLMQALEILKQFLESALVAYQSHAAAAPGITGEGRTRLMSFAWSDAENAFEKAVNLGLTLKREQLNRLKDGEVLPVISDMLHCLKPVLLRRFHGADDGLNRLDQQFVDAVGRVVEYVVMYNANWVCKNKEEAKAADVLLQQEKAVKNALEVMQKEIGDLERYLLDVRTRTDRLVKRLWSAEQNEPRANSMLRMLQRGMRVIVNPDNTGAPPLQGMLEGGILLSGSNHLSTGEQYNIALSLYLASVGLDGTYFLDEPFLHLDGLRRADALDLLRAMAIEPGTQRRFVLTSSDEYLMEHLIEKCARVGHDLEDDGAPWVPLLRVFRLDRDPITGAGRLKEGVGEDGEHYGRLLTSTWCVAQTA